MQPSVIAHQRPFSTELYLFSLNVSASVREISPDIRPQLGEFIDIAVY